MTFELGSTISKFLDEYGYMYDEPINALANSILASLQVGHYVYRNQFDSQIAEIEALDAMAPSEISALSSDDEFYSLLYQVRDEFAFQHPQWEEALSNFDIGQLIAEVNATYPDLFINDLEDKKSNVPVIALDDPSRMGLGGW